jgi:Domain of unknown function (DUF4349)
MADRIVNAWSILAVCASALALAACGEAQRSGQAPPAPGPQSPVQASQFSVLKRLAVSHAFSLRMPSIEVEAVQQRHLAECNKLGCTVLTTNLDRSIEGRVTARSTMRIAPAAYPAFAAVITAAPSELVSHTESTEDKTAEVLDVEKRLEVKVALRDRLSAMLKDSRATSLADLLAIEKELAQIQGDIEATTAQRDYLRTITETVRLDIVYHGQPAVVSGVDFSPISFAVSGASRTVVWSVAALISFLAALVPWLPLIALVWWAVRRSFRRWRAAKAPV